jgi:2-aminoadipate transaminase
VTGADLGGTQPAWPAEAVELWAACAAAAARRPELWRVPAPQGDELLRERLSAALDLDAERLTVVGSVRAAAVTYARRHRRVVLERPGWQGLTAALTGSRATLERAGVAELARTRPPAGTVLWLTSPHRNPDGHTLSAPLAGDLSGQVRAGARVVANEAYRWFGAGPRVPGADLVGSLHKLGGLGSRIGWVHSAGFFDEAVPELVGSTPSAVWQHAWGRFLAAGGLALLHAAVVAPALAAGAAFDAELGGQAVAGPHRLLRLPSGAGEADTVGRLAAAGWSVGPGSAFGAEFPSVRLSFLGVSAEQAAEFAAAVRGGLLEEVAHARPGA